MLSEAKGTALQIHLCLKSIPLP